ncbi:MAG: hypothetical protein WAL56_01455, partial [Candidatus Sulfotelmatobacter sp.]
FITSFSWASQPLLALSKVPTLVTPYLRFNSPIKFGSATTVPAIQVQVILSSTLTSPTFRIYKCSTIRHSFLLPEVKQQGEKL